MPGLFDSLSIAARSLDAQRMGLDVAGQNIANVNTEGYSRRMLHLAEIASLDSRSAGRGVDVVGIRALRDRFVEARMVRERQSEQRNAAMAQVVSGVETALGRPGQSLDRSLTSYFDAFSELAQDATSTVARDQVVSQGQSLARDFNQMAERLESARAGADSEIRGVAEQVNAIAAEVAKLNGKIAGSNGADVESLRDRRNVLVQQLADLAGVSVSEGTEGAVDVSIGNGRPLVIGNTPYAIAVGSAGPTGNATLSINGSDITTEITGGRIGGLIEARDTLVPAYQARLDQLAYDFANGVNTVHRTGYDTSGGTNRDFFVPPAAVAGAARALAVDPAIVADSGLVAASSTGASGDNQTAQAIAALRDAPLVGGTATPAEAWAQLVYRVGADGASAQAGQKSDQLVIDQLSRLRDSVSAVSIDEEAAWLMKYQRAYEANARYFTTINSALDVLMAMVN
jgi:flagellar hook-associated protein 1